MTAVLVLVLLGAIAAWIFGSFALRAVGLFFFFFFFFGGLLTILIAGRVALLSMVVIGAILWLSGHWLHAYRHHSFASPLARRIFLQVLPPRLNPTRGWGIPVVDVTDERHP
jgi:hypothetical protein